MFSLPDEDYVRMCLCFIGQQGHMWASHHHSYAALAKLGGQIVGMERARRVKSDSDQVDIRRDVNLFHGLVNMIHLPSGRNKGRQVRHRDLLKVQHPRPSDPTNFRCRRSDQEKSSMRRQCTNHAPLSYKMLTSGQ
jgi:hypothetical protein